MGVTVKKCHMIMSGNDCWNSVCFSCCQKADNELAEEMTAIKHKENAIECGFENNVMTNRNKSDNFENIKRTAV